MTWIVEEAKQVRLFRHLACYIWGSLISHTRNSPFTFAVISKKTSGHHPAHSKVFLKWSVVWGTSALSAGRATASRGSAFPLGVLGMLWNTTSLQVEHKICWQSLPFWRRHHLVPFRAWMSTSTYLQMNGPPDQLLSPNSARWTVNDGLGLAGRPHSPIASAVLKRCLL